MPCQAYVVLYFSKGSIYIYICICKTHVQAALGPIALDLARKLNSSEHIELANSVLVVSVLAIVLTAPLGAVLMIRLAPVWLQNSVVSNGGGDEGGGGGASGGNGDMSSTGGRVVCVSGDEETVVRV